VVILSAAKTSREAGVAGPARGVESTTGSDPATDDPDVTLTGSAGG
jgi:hypothetical protein